MEIDRQRVTIYFLVEIEQIDLQVASGSVYRGSVPDVHHGFVLPLFMTDGHGIYSVLGYQLELCIYLDVGRWEPQQPAQFIAGYNPPGDAVGPSQEMCRCFDIAGNQGIAYPGRAYADVVDILPGDLLDLKSIFRSVFFQLPEAAFTVVSESMIIADNKFARTYGVDQDFSDEILRRII